MVNCCVPYCSSDRRKKRGISFHQFPVQNHVREKWILNIRRLAKDGKSLWMPRDFSAVCSLHFSSDSYKNSARYRLLKNDAVPTIFPGYPASKSLVAKKKDPFLNPAENVSELQTGQHSIENFIPPGNLKSVQVVSREKYQEILKNIRKKSEQKLVSIDHQNLEGLQSISNLEKDHESHKEISPVKKVHTNQETVSNLKDVHESQGRVSNLKSSHENGKKVVSFNKRCRLNSQIPLLKLWLCDENGEVITPENSNDEKSAQSFLDIGNLPSFVKQALIEKEKIERTYEDSNASDTDISVGEGDKQSSNSECEEVFDNYNQEFNNSFHIFPNEISNTVISKNTSNKRDASTFTYSTANTEIKLKQELEKCHKVIESYRISDVELRKKLYSYIKVLDSYRKKETVFTKKLERCNRLLYGYRTKVRRLQKEVRRSKVKLMNYEGPVVSNKLQKNDECPSNFHEIQKDDECPSDLHKLQNDNECPSEFDELQKTDECSSSDFHELQKDDECPSDFQEIQKDDECPSNLHEPQKDDECSSDFDELQKTDECSSDFHELQKTDECLDIFHELPNADECPSNFYDFQKVDESQ